MNRNLLALAFITIVTGASAQNNSSTDTLFHKDLPDITLVGRGSKKDMLQMPEIVGTNIYAGKKNALIIMDNVQGNVVTNNMRQVMAKVSGVHVWESDPSGIQVGIAARGLSPNRSWEFNTRQNGYDIAADPFGYPEAYYNPQLQSVQRIEIVRGQGSLQYGPQFGGMINYILKNGSEIKKPFEFETQQTFGSYRLFNSYNALGGKKGKIHYYSFFDHRNGNGFRENSRYYTNSAFGTITYKFTNKFSLTAELMHSHIRSQQPGGLTDAQVYEDPQQSFRGRNWFDITWITPAVTAKYQLNEHTFWNTKVFATIGNRNSVGFLQSILQPDSINAATHEYKNRVLNEDKYRNYAIESRILTGYSIGKMKNTVSAGVRLYTGNTWRKADGTGTTGSNYDMSLAGKYPRDIEFNSQNFAVFAENIFRIGKKFIVIPGIRYEWLQGEASGRNGYDSAGNEILLQNIRRSRQFILAGIGTEYHLTGSTELYANISQAYRPIQFANLQAPPGTDVVDPGLKDARGYNADLGYRGKWKNILLFDVSIFYLEYNNRVGTITPAGANYRLITNVGASVSKGLESFAEFNITKAIDQKTKADLLIFGSYAFTDARYSGNFEIKTLQGKRVENAPRHILRSGITVRYPAFDFTMQFSHTSSSYSDANNTAASANAQNGLVPAYNIADLSAMYKFSKTYNIKAGINNLFNHKYFTRRAGGYPGPGALPADGRTFYISVGAKF
ncbi:MAG: TonB-dependent receptor [Ferruginibacter sp.]